MFGQRRHVPATRNLAQVKIGGAFVDASSMPKMCVEIPLTQACPMATGCPPHELNSVQK
jgi:hypothetical protein